MSKLSNETLRTLGDVQTLLRGMYDSGEKQLEKHTDEYKKPQTEDEAFESLLGIGIAHGVMKTTTFISKFINDLTDEDMVEKAKKSKNEKKYWDVKCGKVNKENEAKEVNVEEIPDEDKKEILNALAETFGLKVKVEDK